MAVTRRDVVYKTVNGAQLHMHLFEVEARETEGPLPAIVFFFGGGWVGGSPEQFFPHCEYLASRGMVGASAEYRVKNRHGTTVVECVKDGKSAVRWLRAHADELGIDPDRIAAGGGSAGGHVALCTALIDDLDEPDEDPGVSSKPNALVLFNPVVDTTHPATRAARGGGAAERISPIHHVKRGDAPTIIFHGTADALVPIAEIERFCAEMKSAGNVCELVVYEGQEHAFFNYRDGSNSYYAKTVSAADRFLANLGWLEGEPTIREPP